VEHKLPGRQIVDAFGPQVESEHPDRYLEQSWPLDEDAMTRLEEVLVDRTQERFVEGLYGWNDKWDDCDNCSSWALKVVRYILGDADSVPCSRPKCLEAVEREVMRKPGIDEREG
jgi:hypothetical protein